MDAVPGDGRTVRRDASGAVVEEAHFLNGALDGPFRVFDPGGRLLREAGFANGALDGPDRSFDEDGRLALEIPWRNGRRDGILRRFEGGVLRLEARYREDRLDGEMRSYGENGGLAALIPHRGGLRHGVMEIFGPDGRKLKTLSYVDGVLDGVAEDLDGEGAVLARALFVRGVKIAAPHPDAPPSPAPGPATEDAEAALVAELRRSFYDTL